MLLLLGLLLLLLLLRLLLMHSGSDLSGLSGGGSGSDSSLMLNNDRVLSAILRLHSHRGRQSALHLTLLRRDDAALNVTARTVVLGVYLCDSVVVRAYHVDLRGGARLGLQLGRDRGRVIRERRRRLLLRMEARLNESDRLQLRERDDRRARRLQALHHAAGAGRGVDRRQPVRLKRGALNDRQLNAVDRLHTDVRVDELL